MGMKLFDKAKEYAAEAKRRWGDTEAWKESRRREEKRTGGESREVGAGMMDIFRRFGLLRGEDPTAAEAQALVAELKQFITDHYYECTTEILRGLGQMYVQDQRFAHSIDHAGGLGTAQLASAAIAHWCENNP